MDFQIQDTFGGSNLGMQRHPYRSADPDLTRRRAWHYLTPHCECEFSTAPCHDLSGLLGAQPRAQHRTIAGGRAGHPSHDGRSITCYGT